MKVLLAVDGSAYTKKMLAYLAAHDLLSAKHEYTSLTVQSQLPTQARAALGRALVQKYYEDESARVMAPVIKFLSRHDISCHCSHKVGKPGEMIAKMADEGAFDLVVMGSHGHGALLNLVVGSVATEVLASCKVPVLIIR